MTFYPTYEVRRVKGHKLKIVSAGEGEPGDEARVY